MAVIEYLEGDHPGGFIGIRAVTTLGSCDQYRQAYFPYRDYSPPLAQALADKLNEQWRQQAAAHRSATWLTKRPARAGLGWLATGLRADLLRENKIRGGERRMYFAPAFVVDRRKDLQDVPRREFRVNVPDGKTLEDAFNAAVSHYACVRRLTIGEQAELLSRQPLPDIFVQLAIKLGMKDYSIDINAIRRRVGVSEL